MLAMPFERQAEAFVNQFLVDEDQVKQRSFTHAWEIAEHFGVPEEMVRIQGRLM